MGRLVKTTPAAQEQQEEKRTVVGTGAHGRLVKTGDVQRTSPAANTAKTPTAQSVYQKALDEAMMKRAAADQKNKERGRKSYNRTHAQEVREITGDRTKKSITPIIKSAAAGYAADMVGAADTLLRAPSGLNYAASQERGEIEASKKNIAAYTEKLKAAKTEEERQQWQTLIDRNKRLIEINSKAAGERVKNYQDATKGAQKTLQGTYQKLRKTASDNMEKANEGLTPVGKYLNNVGVAGAQMVADAALGGGSALGPMFLRVFGGNSQEAAETADKPGMSAAEQLDAQNRALLYGTASGAVSIATEKISNVAAPFKKAFGGGFLDKAIDGAIAKMNGNAAGRLALSFLSEGGEEVIEDLVQPALQTIYNGKRAGQNYSELDAADILNDFLVGGALGLLGSGVEGVQRRSAQIETERAAAETKEATPSAEAMTPEETAPTAQRPAEQQAQQNTTQEPAPTVGQQNTMPAQSAVTSESAQGTGGGNLTPTQPNATQGAAEGKADALDAGKRVNLLEYSNEQNAQKVEDGLKDGTLAVDAKENIYRVNEDQHIDRRDSASVGERSVNAFQFDHPELHGYYADAAAVLQEEMSFAQKGGELIRRTSREAGDDEYIRTKRGVSERIARLLDDEGVRYDDIDRSLSAIIHNHGQENFAAAKRVELLLDDMLTNGYTDIHGQHIAPNEEYIAAKKAIPGADMSERTHEELPIYDMPEGRNGGIDNAGQETQNDAAGAELADAGERGGVSERSGRRDAGARTGEQGGRLGRGGSQRAAEQSGAAIERQNLARNLRLEPVSSAELGVRAGTDTKSVTVLPESAWDAKLQETAQRIQYETSKTPVFVLGSIPVRGRDRVMRVRGVWAGGQIIVQADHMSVSPEQIASHEIFHEYADQNPGLIQAVERSIREKYSDKEFDGIVESYIRNLRGIIDIDENAADYEVEQALLDVKNEILADAYAGINAFGEKAGKYQEDVQQTLEERGIVDTGRETAAATERRTGPPERYSVQRTQGIPYQEQIDAFYEGDLKTVGRSDDIYVTGADGSPDALGLGGKPFFMLKRNLQKITRKEGANKNYSAHGIEEDIIRDLPDMLKDPAMIIVEGDRISVIPGRTVDTAREKAAPLLIGVNPNGSVDGRSAYEIKTMYGREGFADWIGLRAKDSKIIAGNKNKATALLRNVGIKITEPVAYAADLTDAILSQSKGDVKSPTLGDEIRRQIMGTEAESLPGEFGYKAERPKDYRLDDNVSDDGGNVKPKTLGDEIRRQMKEKFSIDDTEEDLLAQQDEADRRKRETREAEDEKLADRALKEDQRRQRQEAKEEEKRQRQQESAYAKAERDAKREDAGNLKPVRKVTKPTEESKPTIAKRDLQKAILDTFSVPVEERDALRTTIDRYADSVIKNGKLTEKERDAFFDKMYESGIIKTTADETMRSMGQYVAHRKIYVPAEVKTLFGQDWNGFRKRAYAAGVYLTNDKSAIGVDAFNAELSEQLPTVFDRNETDGKQVLERIVQMAEEGQAERVSLSDYIAEIAGKDSVRGEQLYRELEQKMDNALQTFAEKADLEIKLRDRTNMKLAQQRERFSQRQQEQRAQQKEWESAAKAKKQAENEERERKARERDMIREAKARERRTEAARRRRENRELREMQQKTLKQLQWLSKNRNRAPEALKERWDDVLGDIDIYAISAADELHWSDKYKATWRSLGEMYKRAEKEDPNFLPSEDLKHIVARLDNDKIGDMDIDALTDLYKAAVGLRTEFYNRNNVLNDDMGRMFQEVYTDATRELRSAPKGKKYKSKSGELFDELINDQQLSPMNVLQRMGGWNPNGAFYSMAKQLESGERDVRDYTVKANRLLENFLNEHQDWVKKADGQGKDAVWYELELPELVELRMGDKPIFGETVKVYMTPAQKVHLYLESKNYANLQHMAGGRTFVDKELYSKGKRAEALAGGKTVKLAPETVKKIVSDLTPEEAELAKILGDYYNDFAPKAINKVSNTLLGYDKAITKNYAPIFSNQNYTKSEFGKFDVTAEGVGHLKPREYSKNPSYNISAFDAFERHVDQTARYTGMAIPTRNMNTLMNWGGIDSSMRDTIAHEWGDAANKYITDLVTDMQGGKAENKAWTDKLTDKAFSNYISAVFGFNPSIVLKQLGSIPMGSAYLGAKNFPSVKQIRSIDTDLISKYTQELQWRTMGYSMPETKQLKDNPNWTETNRFTNFAFGGGAITAMDGWAASVLWPQAENKVRREHPNLEVGTKEQIDTGESPFYQEVAREFNDAVARSQSTSDIIHQGTLRRSKSAIARAFTLFKSDSSQTYNAIRQKYGELQFYKNSGANEETVKKAKKSLGEAVTAAIVNAVWSQTVTFMIAALKNGAKRYRDDDDELTIESVLKKYGTGLVGDLAGVMAGGEELADIFGNMLSGDQWYRIETPGLEQLDDLIEGIIKRGGSLKKHGDEMIDILKNGGDLGEYMCREGNDLVGWLKDVAKDIATYGYGIPANNVEAYLLGIVRSISPEAAAAYEDAAARVEKSDLSHTHGRTLKAKTRDLLKDRTGSGKRATADTVASLYDDGYTGALPSATPNSVTIDGETHKLSAYQTQVYEKAWRKAVGGALDEMVTLNAFRNASKETREKMLKNLYAYAGDVAKAAAFSEYEPKKSTQQISESAKHGLTVAVQIVSELADEDAPKGLSLPTP
jgi:hypothetical protein